MSGHPSGPPTRTDRSSGAGPASRDTQMHPGLRILAIDDSASARKIFQGVLMRLGVGLPDLRFAATATEALQVFTQWNPDLVFIDLELSAHSPGQPLSAPSAPNPLSSEPSTVVDGDTLAQQFLERNPRLHLVVVTACDRDHPRVKALIARGAADVIVKPVLAGRVQQVLERFVSPSAGDGRTKGTGRNS